MRVEPRGDATQGLEGFAKRRGLPIDFLGRHGVHIAQSVRPGWIVFPYTHLSGEWHKRYRNPDPDADFRYWAPGGSEVHLYNPLHLGPNTDEVWFCEGEVDTLTLIHLGLPAVGVSGTQGFRTAWSFLYEGSHVVVAFDNDEAGNKKGGVILGRFEPSSYRFTPDYGDINGWHLGDPEGLKRAIKGFREENGLNGL